MDMRVYEDFTESELCFGEESIAYTQAIHTYRKGVQCVERVTSPCR